MLYKNNQILEMLNTMKKSKKLLPEIRGAEFIKNNEQYKILEYAPQDGSGILQSKNTSNLLLVYSFPYLRTLNWKVQDEYKNEPSSIKKCIEDFNINQKKVNIME